MSEKRTEFGKRRPLPPPPATPPVKRSGHVALLLMGAVAVGGTAYALIPRERCEQPADATAQTSDNCRSRSSGSSGSGRWSSSHWGFTDSGSDSGRSSSSGSGSESSASHVSRGGFGSFGHSIGFSSGS